MTMFEVLTWSTPHMANGHRSRYIICGTRYRTSARLPLPGTYGYGPQNTAHDTAANVGVNLLKSDHQLVIVLIINLLGRKTYKYRDCVSRIRHFKYYST